MSDRAAHPPARPRTTVRARPSALALGVALSLAALFPAREARAQCASQAACPSPCTQCRIQPAMGTNPSVAEMSGLFDQIAAGPAVYGSLGWDFGTRNTIHRGNGWCGGAGARDTVPAHFPCVLLKAIYTTESNWRQFCTSNLTVIAFDCGYGIAQVTSGMRPGETSAYDANRVASSAPYNVSVGAAILADKWRASACIGDNDPDVIEDWYLATWGYNGFAFKNNPNNPMYPADRMEYRTPGVPSAQTRGNYPYQEVVWGYAHYPPSAMHWTGIGLAYPARSEICASCGFPMADLSEPPGAHRSTCPGGAVTMPDAGVDVVSLDAATRDGGMDGASDGGSADAADGRVADTRPADGGTTENPGGCGCRAAGYARSREGALPGAAAVLALAAVAARRRRGARRG